MFADSLLENSGAQRSRRGWTTLSSFGLQALIMGILLLLPLIRPIALPFLQPLTTPIALTVPRGLPPAQQTQRSSAQTQSNMINNIIVAPRTIPNQILHVDELAPPPQITTGTGLAPGATGGQDLRGIFGSVGTERASFLPATPPPVANHVRVSRMMEGNLLRRVQPEYPAIARNARIQGTVVLSAVISKEGMIEKVQVLTGHPLLVQAAVEAVKQWRYRPYVLNDQPVEVETQITVNFSLNGS
ncbi:MAG TPA: energy transducer TonB [Candidatus Sulfotelmatobacter sp.]